MARLEVVALNPRCTVAQGYPSVVPGTTVTLTPQGIGFGRLDRPATCFLGTRWVKLECDWVGRHHSAIVFEDGGWCVQHSGTTNDTRLNGKRVDRSAALRDGDLIEVALSDHGAAVTLRFRLGS